MAFDVDVKDGIAELVLNKPPVNAFDHREWAELAALFTGLGRDENVRVIVLAAEGRGFCAGVDVKELAEKFVAARAAPYLTKVADKRATLVETKEAILADKRLSRALEALAMARDHPIETAAALKASAISLSWPVWIMS